MGHLIFSWNILANPCWGSQDAMLEKFVQTWRLILESYQKNPQEDCMLADLQWRYIEPDCQDLFVLAPSGTCLADFGGWHVAIDHLYLPWSDPTHPELLGAFARRHSIVATGTGANAAWGGVGGKACWAFKNLGWVVFFRENPKVMDEFRRAACEFTGFKNRNMHSENIFKHRPWRIAAGHLSMNLPRSIHPFFVSRWLDLCRFFQGLHLHRFDLLPNCLWAYVYFQVSIVTRFTILPGSSRCKFSVFL